jgi:hypothetical protein
MNTDKKSEKKDAATSYIITLYNNVMGLTAGYAIYKNILIELKNKYGDENINKLVEADKKSLIETIQDIRFKATINFIQYETLKKEIKDILSPDDDKLLRAAYEAVSQQYIIMSEDLKILVSQFNYLLLNQVMSELLTDSQNYLDKIYNDNKKEA